MNSVEGFYISPNMRVKVAVAIVVDGVGVVRAILDDNTEVNIPTTSVQSKNAILSAIAAHNTSVPSRGSAVDK